MNNSQLLPPLRLVLNTACNGNCCFCHHEGVHTRGLKMQWNTIEDCIHAASQMGISKISLTGGEPTIRDDLSQIITAIKQVLPNVTLGITTNGFGIQQLSKETLSMIDSISLSITSLKKDLYQRYQNVDPEISFACLQEFADKTIVNIIAVNDNEGELPELIDRCFSYGFSVDLMFELYSNDTLMQKRILSSLTDRYGIFSLQYASTPVMVQCETGGRKIRIKAPAFSNVIIREICKGCPHYGKCPEKICALRVSPEGKVSPCLNNYIHSSKESVIDQIRDLYPQLGVSSGNIYDYFFG